MLNSESKNCPVRRRLGEEFALAARLYAEAVVQLMRDPITMSDRDYQQLHAAVEQARARSEVAGRAFKEHVESHGCGSFTRGVEA
jgi:hypothetical protein